MKMFLRQQKTRCYYTGQASPAQWSENEAEAQEFHAFPDVDALCAQLGFKDMEIVLKFSPKDERVIKVKAPPKKP